MLTQIRLLLKEQSDRVYTVCHSTKYFKNQLHKKANLDQKVCNKVFEILGHLLFSISRFQIRVELNLQSVRARQRVSNQLVTF